MKDSKDAITTIIIMADSTTGTNVRTVNVINEISSQLILIVHCGSGDDDLKAQTVAYRALAFQAKILHSFLVQGFRARQVS
ncbi:hypothetical protein LINPERPRIM_LOCUS20291 [Linum perenne]